MKRLLICVITYMCYGMDDPASHELELHLMSIKPKHQSNIYQNELCGICKKAAPNRPWISHNSKFAHHTCIELATPAFLEALQRLDLAFKNNINLWNKAHIQLIRHTQAHIGINKTIFEYLQQTNIRALKSVVDMYIDDTINFVRQKSL